MKRHQELTIRNTSNIKRTRAAVSREEVRDYFERLGKTLEGVPPENIWNYDETNLSQNPGTVKAIFKRGIKYAEEVWDQSKNSISVMFCGSASGELMPPYVVYRGNYCYPTWGQGGAPGVHYGATPSGSVLVPVPTGSR